VLLLIVRCRWERAALEKERTFFATTNFREGGSSAKPLPNPLPEGEGNEKVQTGNIVYRMNRAHGLHCVGKEEDADAVEGNQCHGPKNSVDS
jgi:hypothetical protein